jgi:uncharacterized membrane protein
MLREDVFLLYLSSSSCAFIYLFTAPVMSPPFFKRSRSLDQSFLHASPLMVISLRTVHLPIV